MWRFYFNLHWCNCFTENITIHRTWRGYYWASEPGWWRWDGCMCVWPVAWWSGWDKEKETDSCCQPETGTVSRAAEEVSPFTKANMTNPVLQQPMSSRGFELIQSKRQRTKRTKRKVWWAVLLSDTGIRKTNRDFYLKLQTVLSTYKDKPQWSETFPIGQNIQVYQ